MLSAPIELCRGRNFFGGGAGIGGGGTGSPAAPSAPDLTQLAAPSEEAHAGSEGVAAEDDASNMHAHSARAPPWMLALGCQPSDEEDDAAELAELLASAVLAQPLVAVQSAAALCEEGLSGTLALRCDAAHGFESSLSELARAGAELAVQQSALEEAVREERALRARAERRAAAQERALLTERTRRAEEEALRRAALHRLEQLEEERRTNTHMLAVLRGDVHALVPMPLEALQALWERLGGAREAVEKALLSAKVNAQLADQNGCAICMERALDTALGPCGHRLCGVCAERLDKCHVCRTAVATRMRVY